MSKIYIVTSGEYSDYNINAVFSEKQLAKKYIAKFDESSHGNYFEIEEWSLDSEVEKKPGYTAWKISMDKFGNSISTWDNQSFDYPMPPVYKIEDNIHNKNKEWIRITLGARSEEHAIKIANEIRTQVVALNLWIVDDETKTLA